MPVRKPQSLTARVIHACQVPDYTTGTSMTTIYQTSTCVQSNPGVRRDSERSRTHGPAGFAYDRCGAALKGGGRWFRACLRPADSLAGGESLIEHPSIMPHASVPPAIRKRLGISDDVIRLSAGVEDIGDLRAELAGALA